MRKMVYMLINIAPEKFQAKYDKKYETNVITVGKLLKK